MTINSIDIINQLPAYIYWKNVNLLFDGCNQQWANLIGLENGDDIIGKSDGDFCSNHYPYLLVKQDESVIKTGDALSFKKMIKNITNENLWLRIQKYPLYQDNRISGLLTIAFDVTEETGQLQKVIDEKEFIETIIYNFPGLIYWKNTNSQYIGFNRNITTLSGLDKKTLYGKKDTDLNWGKKEAKAFIKDDQYVMQTGETLITEHTIPVKHNGDINKVVRTEKSRLVDKKGVVQGVLGVAVDITEEILAIQLKESNKIINQKKDDLSFHARKDSVKEAVLAVAHEINQPLSAVSNYASGCLKRLEKSHGDTLPSDIKDGLEKCIAQARRAGDIIHSLKDFLSVGNVYRQENNVNLIITELLSFLGENIQKNNIRLKLNLESQLPKIQCDRIQIELVLTNLIKNACEAMVTNDTRNRLLSISTKSVSENTVSIIIEDTGIGIKSGILEKIFFPFVSTKIDGVGLGLSLSHHIIESHYGKVDVSSLQGEGSKFTVKLPVR